MVSLMSRASVIFTVTLMFFLLGSGVVRRAFADDDEIASYAIVQKDGSLRVSGHTIWLYGIYIPDTNRICRTFIRPVKCMPRAVLQLDFKIGSNFVHCDPVTKNADGSLNAVCRVKDEDLGAWMVKYGWAVALPDAPFEYTVLEKIAREGNRGIWGRVIDR